MQGEARLWLSWSSHPPITQSPRSSSRDCSEVEGLSGPPTSSGHFTHMPLSCPSANATTPISVHLCISESVPLPVQPKDGCSFSPHSSSSKPDVVPGHCPERWVWGPGAEISASSTEPPPQPAHPCPFSLVWIQLPVHPQCWVPSAISGRLGPPSLAPWPPTPSPHPDAYSLNTRPWVSVLHQIQPLCSPPPGSPKTLP